MPTYTIALATRSADRPNLSDSEAANMAALGFRFAEFTPEASRYRLSIPYRTLHNLDRNTLTFTQEPIAASIRPAPASPPDESLFEPAVPQPKPSAGR